MAQRKNLISGTTANREHAHEPIDQLPGCPLSGLIGFLETIVRGKQLDPVAAALPNAPIDDEPLTGEGRRAIAAADEWLRRNDPIPLEDVLADFGLTTADWETMGRTPLPELKKSNGAPEEESVMRNASPSRGKRKRNRAQYLYRSRCIYCERSPASSSPEKAM